MKYAAAHFSPVGHLTGYGHFWDVDLEAETCSFLRTQLPRIIHDNKKRNLAYNEDAIALVSRISCDVLYVDSPYSCRGGSYQECLAFFDDMVRVVSGKGNEIVNRFDGKADLPPFCDFVSRASALSGFAGMFRNAADIPIVIVSYNTTSKVAPEEIIDIARMYGRKVSIEYIPYPLPSPIKGKCRWTKEVLIKCTRGQNRKGR
jgi:adenine-specific DNA-methyltransferase